VAVRRELEAAASIAWRCLVVAAAVAVVVYLLSRVRLVLIPVAAALLIATALTPPTG
jgi:predicted PurR-regulated permease PerM